MSQIMQAAAAGDVAALARFWEQGLITNIDARASIPDLPPGCTLLMCAAAAGQTNAAEWLLQHEASVNLHAQGGVTALMFAVLGQDIATLKLLCAARASLDAVELEHQDHVRVEGRRTAPRGHTPLEIAEANGNKTAVAILREHGEHLRHESDAAAAALLEEEELLQSSSSSPLGRSAGKSGKRERERKRAALRRERQQHQHQPPHDPQESQEQQESTSVSEQQFARLLLATDRETSSSSSGQARSVDEEAASTSSSSSHSQAHSETPPSSETPSALNSALNSAAAAAAAAAAARRRGARLESVALPPPPSTPSVGRRVTGGRAAAATAHDVAIATLGDLGGSSSSALSAVSSLSAAVLAMESTAPGGFGTAPGGSGVAAAAAAELEELQRAQRSSSSARDEMERRAEAKNRHMAELDARFEQLQMARAASSSSLAAHGSSTSLVSIDSAADSTTADETLTCVICMERPTDATLVHGNSAHVCCCLPCATSLKSMDQSCPMCRKPIEAVLRLYFA